MIAPALDALRAHRQFILYQLVQSPTRPGKMDKFPCDAHGRKADAHNSENWLSLEGAATLAKQFGKGWGVGFVITPATKLFCLDIDDCLLPDGASWSPPALQVCAMFPGAAVEVSQSGRGLHIWGSYTGDMPAHGCKNVPLHLELYTEKRFIALGLPDSATGSAATDCTLPLQCAIPVFFPPEAGAGAGAWSEGPVPEWRGPSDDGDLLRRALQSRSASSAFGNKASFADLWTANLDALSRAYPAEGRPYDGSSADAALAQHLLFWTGKDCERTELLMRQSGLVREKWDRADGQFGTYLRRTIFNANGMQHEVLTDKAPAAMTPQGGAVALQGVEMSLLQLGTQDAVALLFAKKKSGKMLYNHTRGMWLEWDGTRWRVDVTQKALNFARDLARSMNYEGKSSLGSASFCDGVEKMAKADPALSVTGSEFDRDNYLLNTPGGTFDLRTNTMRPHNPDDCISLCTAATPSPKGGEAFEKCLDEVTMGNRELAEFLQVTSGACLSGAVECHHLLFWIGQGRNGKNTLGDLIQDAMGDYARKVPTSTLMAKAHESHPTEIANLQGVRLAISSEINDGAHWDEARINEVTGDATLTGRYMNRDFFTFKRTHKHLIYGNHRPQLRTVGDAIKSRIKIVPFNASFLGREDGDLPKRLRENLGYVLAWLIEGHRKWLAAGKRLPQCQAVEAESADYFASQSTVDMWLSERVQILNPDERNVLALPKSSELYQDYANWKNDRGENPVSQTRWGESLRAFEKLRSSGVRYRGLMLIPQGVGVGVGVPFPFSSNAQPSYAN